MRGKQIIDIFAGIAEKKVEVSRVRGMITLETLWFMEMRCYNEYIYADGLFWLYWSFFLLYGITESKLK